MWTFNHEDYSVPTNYNHGQRDSHCGYRSNFVLPRHSDRSANKCFTSSGSIQRIFGGIEWSEIYQQGEFSYMKTTTMILGVLTVLLRA